MKKAESKIPSTIGNITLIIIDDTEEREKKITQSFVEIRVIDQVGMLMETQREKIEFSQDDLLGIMKVIDKLRTSATSNIL